MFKQRSVGVATIIAVIGFVFGTTACAEVIVVPNALATIDGNSFDQTPSGSAGALRLLYVFDASQFATLSGPAFLTSYTFRHGIVLGSGLVTQFTFQPIPEPSSLALASLGALGVLGYARQRRQSV